MKALQYHLQIATITLLFLARHCRAKILRNNALMAQMMSHFQKDNSLSAEPQTEPPPDAQDPGKILNLMQNVLCRNFPTIPCKLIMRDTTLNQLIGESIQQLSYKQSRVERTTAPPAHLPLFPLINSEDLSNFLAVQNTGYFSNKRPAEAKVAKKRKGVRQTKLKTYWSHEKHSKKSKSKEAKRMEKYTSRKKMRKFYPHKIKYKDKRVKNEKNFREYSEEKLSMSVEVPDLGRGQQMAYKAEPADPPVWRIDYTKHGEPSLNMFAYGDERLRGKLMKPAPGAGVADEDVLEQAVRKEVLHPDVYIKKNFVRKNAAVNSEAMTLD